MYNVRRYQRDWMVVLGIIFIVVMLYGTMLWGQRERLSEQTAMAELRAIRLAVTAFYYVNGRNPSDLEELVESSFKTDDVERSYIPKRLIEKKLVDPMGNSYEYDPETGWVKSISKEYQGW